MARNVQHLSSARARASITTDPIKPEDLRHDH
jgi:hypothetical protein